MYCPGDDQTAVRIAWEVNKNRGLSDQKLIEQILFGSGLGGANKFLTKVRGVC